MLEVDPILPFDEFKSRLGEFINTVDYPITSALAAKDKHTQKLLFILQKNVLPPCLIEPVIKNYLPFVKKMTSSNRGLAAGNIERVQKGKYERSSTVHSTVAGYIDSSNHKYPCRLTKFSREHFQAYQTGVPLLQYIDTCFKTTLPSQYEAQLTYAEKTPFRIADTAFTTVTMNYNFQTAIHVDKGDCKEGFGILVVFSDGITGGELLFPRYRLRIKVETGDLLFMNVHEYHCNLPITQQTPAGYRLSLVCYLREKLLDCKQNKLLEDLGVPENKHWDTSLLIDKILNLLNISKDTKEQTAEGWSYENEHYQFYHRKKQYILKDKKTNKKTICLHTILSNIHRQFQEVYD